MKTKLFAIAFLIIGLLAGILFTAITINLSAGNMMLKELKSPYNYEKTVETLVNRINNQPGWHVVKVYDQNEEVIENGGKPIGKYSIIYYCNGKYASKMLGADDRKKIGVMLPKSFSVYEKADGQVFVATANGMIMGKLFGGETENIIEKVSLEVENVLRFVNYKISFF